LQIIKNDTAQAKLSGKPQHFCASKIAARSGHHHGKLYRIDYIDYRPSSPQAALRPSETYKTPQPKQPA
jgi:hypothetical protein